MGSKYQGKQAPPSPSKVMPSTLLQAMVTSLSPEFLAQLTQMMKLHIKEWITQALQLQRPLEIRNQDIVEQKQEISKNSNLRQNESPTEVSSAESPMDTAGSPSK